MRWRPRQPAWLKIRSCRGRLSVRIPQADSWIQYTASTPDGIWMLDTLCNSLYSTPSLRLTVADWVPQIRQMPDSWCLNDRSMHPCVTLLLFCIFRPGSTLVRHSERTTRILKILLKTTTGHGTSVCITWLRGCFSFANFLFNALRTSWGCTMSYGKGWAWYFSFHKSCLLRSEPKLLVAFGCR